MNRTFNFIIAAICCSTILFGTQATAQYTLTVEESTPAVAAGTTYRFYVDMTDATDRFSAIFGNNESPLELILPTERLTPVLMRVGVLQGLTQLS